MLNEEDVKTYGIGQQQTEGNATTGALEPMVPETNSAPPPTAPPAPTSRTPADEPATGALGGGAEPPKQDDPLIKDRGKPQDQVKEMARKDPDTAISTIQTVANGLKQARKGDPVVMAGKARELEQQMKDMGADPAKAGEQVVTEFEKGVDISVIEGDLTEKQGEKKKFAFRNIYNTIKPEEMSLFLIDFGFRAMMAGESMGTLGALGAAGSGAMGALQGRREAAEAKRVEDYKYSRESALDERRVGASERQADAAMLNAESRRDALGQGYAGKDKFLLDFYREQGRSDEWIAQQLSGAGSYEEVYDRAAESVEKMYQAAMEKAPIGGSTINARPVTVGGVEKYWHQLTQKDRATLAKEITTERMAARKQGATEVDETTALNRALTNSQGT